MILAKWSHLPRAMTNGWMPDDSHELGRLALFPMELEPPFSGKSSSENEGRLEDRRSNGGGLLLDNFELIWSELCDITYLEGSLYFENEDGVNNSWSNGDGWMPDDPHELGQLAFFPMELEPPFSGKESNEINGVEGSCEVRSVAGKCPVRRPNAVQLLSASSNNSNCLYVNLRMEDRHPSPLLLWLRGRVLKPLHLPVVGTIFGNLKHDNVLKTDRLFCAQLSYTKNTDFLVKSMPEADDLFSLLQKKNPELRLEGREGFLHPFFWRSNVKLRFLQRMNARLLSKDPASNLDLLNELKSNRPPVFYGNWIDKLDPIFKSYILQTKEKYDFSSLMELVRFIRNKSTHLDELLEKIKELVGAGDEGFYNYFAVRFPRLLMKLYGAAFEFSREEEWFVVFHMENFPEYFGNDAV
ncbi:uncharacterized protein LOC104428958 isoform X2 [Eucalyptus grandis]|uniref:uncharacterized protein LOC104428958 isoform X2 n=1 Tax=Eucalyptus grandis TaxID=71139 RepID=UPI00192F03B6|nr:uncharacterized protein LOC104428958 isoform X2 [Eucalyptus grandis]